ncbi:MAG: hypothetical protein ACYC0W_05330 [Candidatus Nanopelagicales bacterium]
MPAMSQRRSLLAVAVFAATTIGLATAPAQAATSSPSPTPSPVATATVDPSGSASARPDTAATDTAQPAGTLAGTPASSPSPTPIDAEIGRLLTYKTTATAVGANGLATATLAIPAGLVPVVLRGTLTSVADNPGVVRIRVGANYIEMDAETGGDFSLAVPAEAVRERNLTIEVRNTLDLPKEECVFDTTTTETISDLVLGFVGIETPPTTIAGFFSPPVKKVTIVAGASTVPEAEVVLAAAGAMARRYDRDIDIVVMTPDEFAADPAVLDPSAGPERIIQLVPDDTASVQVVVDDPGVPRLTISGPASQLSDAASSLESVGLGLAAIPEASELSETEVNPANPTLTLAELGAPKPTMSGLGRLEYTIAMSQDRFGGPIQSFAVHLEGVHTPVQDAGAATASILWNDQLIASQLVTNDDQFTADVNVDPSLVRRDNFLTIRVDAVNNSGGCNAAGNATQGFQMDIDGNASTVSATPGEALPEGFERFPQAFGGQLRIAFGSGPLTPELVKAGASMVISLQRSAINPLDVTSEDFDTFLAGGYPGMVIGATPQDAVALDAPLRFEDLRAVDFELTRFTVKVDGPFAAMEAFDIDGRNILLLGSTAPVEQSAPLLQQVADEAQDGEFGWFGFKGTMIVAQPGAELLTLSTATLVPQASIVAESRSLPTWWLVVLGLAVLILLARLVMLWRRRRAVRRQIAKAEVADDEEPSDP